MTIFEKDKIKKSFRRRIELLDLSIDDLKEQYDIRKRLNRNDTVTSLIREYIVNDIEFELLWHSKEELHSMAEGHSEHELDREAAGNELLRRYPDYYEEVYNNTEEPRQFI